MVEKCRQQSVALRGTLDAILLNAARDIRTQADNVDRALHNRIICKDEMRQRLEIELKVVSIYVIKKFILILVI